MNDKPRCVECNEPLKDFEIKHIKDWGNRCNYCYKGHEMNRRQAKRDRREENVRRHR